MQDRLPKPRPRVPEPGDRARPVSRNHYYYFDPEDDVFVEVLPRRLEVFARALALVTSAMVLVSLLFPQFAL